MEAEREDGGSETRQRWRAVSEAARVVRRGGGHAGGAGLQQRWVKSSSSAGPWLPT